MSLKPVREVELPAASLVPPPAAANSERRAEPKSDALSGPSRLSHVLTNLDEIRKILNARASVIVALLGAAWLTFLAMDKATGMALAIAASYDVFVFLPLAYIAYLKRKEE